MVAKDQLFVQRRPQGDYAVRRGDAERASAVAPSGLSSGRNARGMP